jgi:hypothetical protein
VYCEIVVKHRDVITGSDLQKAVGDERLGTDIPLAHAYEMSALYKLAPPRHSLFAFDFTPWRCFVIVRSVNYRTSTHHVEGSGPAVSVETLFRATQEYSESLLRALRKPPAARSAKGLTLAARLFEDNGKETGVEGKLVTLVSTFREKFQWSELRSSLVAFVTAMVLIGYGLKQESAKAALVSLMIVLAFGLSEILFTYYRGRGKIIWRLRQV